MSKKTERAEKQPLNIKVNYTYKNETQKEIGAAWSAKKLLILLGPAGTGKTTAALCNALIDCNKGALDGVWLTRPLVLLGKNALGFLPGELEKKMEPWMQSFKDVYSITEGGNSDLFRRNRIVEAVPLGTIQGRTVYKRALIVDEAQNLTVEELVCLLERIGENGKLILCGDPKRCNGGYFGNCRIPPLARLAESLEAKPDQDAAVFRFKPSENLRSAFSQRMTARAESIFDRK